MAHNPSVEITEINIDWITSIIHVPRDAPEMTLIQLTPTPIYNLDLNAFRLKLKEIESSEEGMPYLDTHNHNTEVVVGGLSLARVIEIINGYTVTFEDGQYAVNLVGANSNVGDVVNVNQVSVRSQNSAGMISSPAIEYSSFGGGVYIDVANGIAGSIYNIGTPENPVSNFSDALLIASTRGFDTFFIIGNITVPSGINIEGFTLIGQSPTKTLITVDTGADTLGCEFEQASITGVLDGNSIIKDCHISDISYVYGTIESCILDPGTITLAGSEPASILNCWSGTPGGTFPIIDMGGSGQSLSIQNYNGRIEIANKDGVDAVEISINAGEILLDSTVTNGTIVLSGVGILVDNSTGTDVNTDSLMSKETITEISWDEIWLDETVPGNGIDFPKGTRGDPVDTLAGALEISAIRGITQINIASGTTVEVDHNHNLDNLTFVGKHNAAGMFLGGGSTEGTTFIDIGMTGTCQGRMNLKGCSLAQTPFSTFNDFHGQLERCFLLGPISVLEDIFGIAITDCFSYSAFYLDMNHQDVVVDFRNQSGDTTVRNLTTDTNISISFDAGTLSIENSCVAGTITVEGVARVFDASIPPCQVIQNSTVSKAHTDLIERQVELQRRSHIGLGVTYYWDPYGGDDGLDGRSALTAVATFARCHDLVANGQGDKIICLANDPSGLTTTYENIEVSKDDVMIRSTGREFSLHPADPDFPTVKFTGEGSQLQSMRVFGADSGWQNIIEIDNDHISLDTLWIEHGQMHGVYLTNTKYSEVVDCVVEHCGEYWLDPSNEENPSGIPMGGNGISIGYNTKENKIANSTIWNNQADGIHLEGEGGFCLANKIDTCDVFNNGEHGIHIHEEVKDTIITANCTVYGNTEADILDDSNFTNYSGIDNSTNYNDIVVMDATFGVSGVNYPRGIGQLPSNNITDAIQIARNNGLQTIRIHNSITLTALHDVSDLILTGIGSNIVVECLGANTTATRFDRLFVTGAFNGIPTGNLAGLVDISEVDGVWNDCAFVGTVTIASGAECIFKSCISAVPGTGTPILNMNAGNPGNVNLRAYAGGIEIINMDEATQKITIDLISGNAKVTSTCTAGEIVVRGTGMYTDDSGPDCIVVVEGLSYLGTIAYNNEVLVDNTDPSNGSVGTLYPLGTSGHPVGNMIDAKIIADRVGIRTFFIHGEYVLEENFDGYTFRSTTEELATIDINDQSIENTTFDACTLTGSGVGHFHALNCNMENGFTDIDCTIDGCVLGGTYIPAFGKAMNALNCYAAGPVTFDLGSGGLANCADCTIAAIVINATFAWSVFGITGNHNVTIDASCTSGTAFVTGFSILIVDPSATMTVVENIHPTSIWDQPIANHLDPGTTGEALSDASSGGDADAIAQAVWDLDANPSAIIPGSYGDQLVNGTTDVNAGEIADAVWEEPAADHTTSTTMGGKQNAAAAGGVDYDALADAVWDEDITTHTTADSAGAKLEEASQGGDPNETADAVWDKIINPSDQVPGSYGAEISEISDSIGTISDDSLYSLNTTVDAPIVGFLTTRFTMTDGHPEDDTYENCIIALQDQTDNHIEMRRISAYVGATKQVTVDRAFGFDVVNGDVISISKLSYGGATGAGGGSGPHLAD